MPTSFAVTHPAALPCRAANDPGTLNRAEWIAYLAPFFNREGLASQIYESVKTGYEAAMAPVTADSPTVAWISYTSSLYGIMDADGNAVTGDGLTVSFADYKAELTMDAGGQLADQAAWTAAATIPVSVRCSPACNHRPGVTS